MKKYVIVAGGDYSPLSIIKGEYFLIACDKGYEYVEKQGVVPDLVVGDFDSCKKAIPSDVAVLKLPVHKNDTDTMYAVRHAVAKGATEIVLTCATGARLDHTVANVQCCIYCLKNGVEASIIDAETEIYFVKNGTRTIEKKEGFSLSVFAVSEKCVGVSIKGAEYELDSAVVENSFPIGVSNAWLADKAEISVENGLLMVVLSGLG